jgi:hypothetical protein
MMTIRKFFPSLAAALLVLAVVTTAMAQSRQTLRGVISDEFGATIVGATVTLTQAGATPKTATTNNEGAYTFTGLAPGKYTIQAASSGFAPSDIVEVDLTAARRDPLNLTLKIASIETQVKVDANAPLTTDPTNNANQQVITGKDLDGLPDDPDELAAALQALAGPSMGPNGGQIFVDGFSGTLPPKEAIREIRINQNPFSPENDQPSGRIDILTRPGTDKFRGSIGFNFTDESLDSRNPFSVNSSKRAPYQVRQLNGSISGPIVKKKASFFLNVGHNQQDDNAEILATILDPNFIPTQFGASVQVPRRITNVGPRLDYAINTNNTLIARYNYFHLTNLSGLGGFSLLSKSFNTSSTSQNIQLTETAVINPTTVNEARFQYSVNRNDTLGNGTIPGLSVSSSFNGGGANVGRAERESHSWEFNNFTQIQRGTHMFKFGGRIRGSSNDDTSPTNFAGNWIFTGGFGPQFDGANNPIAGTNVVLSSLERYRRTVLLQQQGVSAAQQAYCGAGTSVNNCIRLLGGGAAQFSINQGNPNSGVSQTDIGVYFQDDWRIRPNFTFSYGIRYENQTNINSNFNFAPRVFFAWSPGAANSTRPPKMVIRAGTGIFYERFQESYTQNADRLNGVNQQSFVVPEPFVGQSAPTAGQLIASASVYNLLNSFRCVSGGPTNCAATTPSVAGFTAQQQAIYGIATNIQAPTMYLMGVQVERQLPKNVTATVGFSSVRRLHGIRQRDINAPLPGTINQITNPTGTRPNSPEICAQYASPANPCPLGDVNQYESSVKFRQTQLFVAVNSRLNPNISFSSNYVLSQTNNDSDGGLPVNSYDLSGEWGRASFDIRHRFSLFGTFNYPKLWKLTFNPFIVINTGGPFNITTGTDTNLDRAANERPTFAQLNAFCSTRPTRCTRFDYSSTSGDFIPRNYGNSPGSVSVNFNVSRTFSFGGEANRRAATSQPQQGGDKTASADGKRGNTGGGRGGPSIGGNMGGGGGTRVVAPGGGGGGPQMMMMGGPGPAGAAKYNLTLSLNVQNVLNHVNFGPPVGNMTSPSFGQSTSVAGGFGGFGGGGGNTGPNRKIYLNARFSF